MFRTRDEVLYVYVIGLLTRYPNCLFPISFKIRRPEVERARIMQAQTFCMQELESSKPSVLDDLFGIGKPSTRKNIRDNKMCPAQERERFVRLSCRDRVKQHQSILRHECFAASKEGIVLWRGEVLERTD